jgi:hypothetical protein
MLQARRISSETFGPLGRPFVRLRKCTLVIELLLKGGKASSGLLFVDADKQFPNSLLACMLGLLFFI